MPNKHHIAWEQQYSNGTSNFFHGEIADRIYSQINDLKLVPQKVLNYACHLGELNPFLQKLYPKADIYNIDSSLSALKNIKTSWLPWKPKVEKIQSDLRQLAIQDQVFDLIVSNLALPMLLSYNHKNLKKILQQWHDLLNFGGVCFFSTLGPSSLLELRQCFESITHHKHPLSFNDMHVIGDQLLASGFNEPVMCREDIKLEYANIDKLNEDLMSHGIYTIFEKAKPSKSDLISYTNEKNTIQLSLEIIYGYALKPKPHSFSNKIRIPVSEIKRIPDTDE